jgi:hypothetical protein
MSKIADSFLKILTSHLYMTFPIFLISALNTLFFMFLFKTF